MVSEKQVRPFAADCIIWGALSSFLIFSILHVFLGRPFLDSGFYIYAAKLVYSGKVPYRDFFYCQPPVYPYLYGAVLKLVGPSIFASRMISLIFGFLSVVLAVHLAKKIGGLHAGVITAGLLGFNVFLSYNFSIAKLYALSSFFLTAATVALFRHVETGRGIFLPALLFALAAGTRLTLFPLAGVFFIFLLLKEKGVNKTVAGAAVIFLIATGIIYVPFLLLAGKEVFYYHMIGLHTQVPATSPYHFGFFNKMIILSNLVSENFFLIFLFVASLFLPGTLRRWKKCGARDRSLFVYFYLPMVILLCLGLHLGSNWFGTDYLTVIFPLLAILTGCRIAESDFVCIKFPSRLGLVFLLGCLLSAFAYGKKDIIFHEGRFLSPYFTELAGYLRWRVPPEGKLIAFNPLIAIESKRELVHGFEGMPFSYTKDRTNEKSALLNTVNDNRLRNIFRNREAAAIIMDEGTFGFSCPQYVPVPSAERDSIINELERYYRKSAIFPPFVDGGGQIRVYLPN